MLALTPLRKPLQLAWIHGWDLGVHVEFPWVWCGRKVEPHQPVERPGKRAVAGGSEAKAEAAGELDEGNSSGLGVPPEVFASAQ